MLVDGGNFSFQYWFRALQKQLGTPIKLTRIDSKWTLLYRLYAAICTLARPWEAILIGAIGALLACPGCAILDRFRIDDPVGCFPTHGVAGMWGLLAVAFFAEKDILKDNFTGEFGIFKGGPWRFLGVQLLLIVAVSAWSAVTTFLELLLVDKLIGMRMTLEQELLGADQYEHGIEQNIPALHALSKVNRQSNGGAVENTAYQAEEEFERPQTALEIQVAPAPVE